MNILPDQAACQGNSERLVFLQLIRAYSPPLRHAGPDGQPHPSVDPRASSVEVRGEGVSGGGVSGTESVPRFGSRHLPAGLPRASGLFPASIGGRRRWPLPQPFLAANLERPSPVPGPALRSPLPVPVEQADQDPHTMTRGLRISKHNPRIVHLFPALSAVRPGSFRRPWGGSSFETAQGTSWFSDSQPRPKTTMSRLRRCPDSAAIFFRKSS
jgi:hypothetical protein